MADVKITQLTELAAAPAVGDELAIVDNSVSQTKRINIANLFTNPNVTGTLTTDGAIIAQNTTGYATTTLKADTTNTGSGGTPELRFELGGTQKARFRVNTSDDVQISTGTGAGSTRFNIASNGDVSLFENTGTTAKFFWDASAESLGIGTTSPDSLVQLKASTEARLKVEETSSAAFVSLYQQSAASYIIAGKTGGTPTQPLLIYTGDSERMRIDASGNLLVGTTQTPATLITTSTTSHAGVGIADGYLSIARDLTGSAGSGGVAFFNRLATDGPIADFRKDGTTVGSIGSNNDGGSKLYIGSSASAIKFKSNLIVPCNSSGTNLDATIGLGDTNSRFTNLFLSGGVYLGGTGAANLLDDYEEGTFTVTLYDASSAGNASATTETGYYTKIGRSVTATFFINDIDTTGMTGSNALYFSLPFASGSQPNLGTVTGNFSNSASADYYAAFVQNSSRGLILGNKYASNEVALIVSDITSGSGDLIVTITYFTA